MKQLEMYWDALECHSDTNLDHSGSLSRDHGGQESHPTCGHSVESWVVWNYGLRRTLRHGLLIYHSYDQMFSETLVTTPFLLYYT